MPISSLADLFVYALGTTYDAEHRLLSLLKRIVARVSDESLRPMLFTHIAESERQIGRLERLFADLGTNPRRIDCAAALGFASDAERLIAEVEGEGHFTDAVLTDLLGRGKRLEAVLYHHLLVVADPLAPSASIALLSASGKEEQFVATMLEWARPRLLRQAGAEGAFDVNAEPTLAERVALRGASAAGPDVSDLAH